MEQKEFVESLNKDIDSGKMVQSFLETEVWKFIKDGIRSALPKKSPYSLDTLQDIKVQGAYISGLTFIERFLNDTIDKAETAKRTLESQPES